MKKLEWGPLFVKFLLFILGKIILNENVEFDFSIGHALVLFPVFLNNKQKMNGGSPPSPSVPPEMHIYRYILDI